MAGIGLIDTREVRKRLLEVYIMLLDDGLKRELKDKDIALQRFLWRFLFR
jgi:hypothetical protein